MVHGLGNEVVLVLFAVSWLVRRAEDGAHEPNALAFVSPSPASGSPG
jgi:hypothetical protein